MIKILPIGKITDEKKNTLENRPTCYCINFQCERSYSGLQGYLEGYTMGIIEKSKLEN